VGYREVVRSGDCARECILYLTSVFNIVTRVGDLPVGYIFSPTLTHSILCSSFLPSWLPTYTVPETCLRSGPAVVVKRAESAFSGKSDFLRAVRPAVEAVLSSVSALVPTGTSMPKSAMIWSAVRRRSEDLSGANGLICEQ
jgi:hypothetical protein